MNTKQHMNRLIKDELLAISGGLGVFTPSVQKAEAEHPSQIEGDLNNFFTKPGCAQAVITSLVSRGQGASVAQGTQGNVAQTCDWKF